MRHMFQVPVVAVFLSVVLALSAENRLLAAEPSPPAAKPAPQKQNTMTLLIDNLALKPTTPQKAPTVMEKLKTLGTLLGRASTSPSIWSRTTA